MSRISGVCLGGQLLAAALGTKVVSNRWEEIGNFSAELTTSGEKDLLFEGIPHTFNVFQWHHDSFDVPQGATLLASSDACPHQAFRVGECAWGMQFHPEVTEEIIRCWSAWDAATRAKTEDFVAVFKAEAENYRATVSQLVRNFLSAAQLLPISARTIKDSPAY